MSQKLILVYNANSGMINSLLGAAHKILAPKTYSCNLCMLTHSAFVEKSIWKKFREESSVIFEFYHLDEFVKMKGDSFVGNYQYPIIFEEKNGVLKKCLGRDQLTRITNVEELISLLVH